MKSHLLKGLRFGLLLSIGGIGPVTILLFSLSSILPLTMVLTGVLAAVFVNFIYISLSILGISKLIIKVNNFEKVFSIISTTILTVLGCFFIYNSFSDLQPIQNIASQCNDHIKIFTSLFFITLMNPMTIIMFAGIFSKKALEDSLTKIELWDFGIGTSFGTLVFLSAVSVIGFFSTKFLPETGIGILNFLTGCLILYWALKKFFIKK